MYRVDRNLFRFGAKHNTLLREAMPLLVAIAAKMDTADRRVGYPDQIRNYL